MDNTKVVVGGNVSGDITSCKIEQQAIKTDRKTVFTFTENTTYVAYDVCNKRIISQYTVPEWTIFGGLMFPLIVFIVISAIAGFFKGISN